MRPDHVGDVLLSAPAIGLLRVSLPEAHLTYVVGAWSLEVARHGPTVDELRTLEFPGFTRRARQNACQSLLAPYALLLHEAARMRKARYAAALILRPDHWWGALLAVAAGIPIRVGGETPETSALLSHTYATPADQPVAEQALAMTRLALKVLGVEPARIGDVPQFTLTDHACKAAKEIHAEVDHRTCVAIHPNAGAPLKSWPAANWARLADALIDDGHAVLLTGAPSDAALLAEIRQQMRHSARIATGQSLGVSAALFAGCALVITVDSGAGHLAAAVGAPTLRLYGPAPPAVFGPWPPRADQHVLLSDALACVPCGALESPPCGAVATPACLLALDVEQVLKAARAQLGQG